jgi:hypothetical protein
MIILHSKNTSRERYDNRDIFDYNATFKFNAHILPNLTPAGYKLYDHHHFKQLNKFYNCGYQRCYGTNILSSITSFKVKQISYDMTLYDTHLCENIYNIDSIEEFKSNLFLKMNLGETDRIFLFQGTNEKLPLAYHISIPPLQEFKLELCTERTDSKIERPYDLRYFALMRTFTLNLEGTLRCHINLDNYITTGES